MTDGQQGHEEGRVEGHEEGRQPDGQPDAEQPVPTRAELQQARDELAAYRDRLAADVVVMGQKLKLPRRMVERNLAQHPELAQVDGVLAQLEQQIAAAP